MKHTAMQVPSQPQLSCTSKGIDIDRRLRVESRKKLKEDRPQVDTLVNN